VTNRVRGTGRRWIGVGLGGLGLLAAAGVMVHSASPGGGTRLLFYEGRATHPFGRKVIVVDSLGRVLAVDEHLRPELLRLGTGSRRLVSAAPGRSGTLWVADASGAVTRLDADGAAVGEGTTPFAYPALSSDPATGAVWAVRSARQFDFGLSTGPSPLAARIDTDPSAGRPTVGQATLPEHALLRSLANAGHLLVAGDTLFFAPFIRDEVLAFGPDGDTLWIATRGLPQSTREPRFEIADGRAVINYHPVNLGLSRGLDGHLYILSTPGFTTETSRLDVMDAMTGTLLRSTSLATALPTLAVSRDGSVHLLDPERLLGGTPPAERPKGPDLHLPLLGGGHISFSDLRGRVVLVNVWASWCAPCRREMPALDQLRHKVSDTSFVFLAINEDRDVEDARRFVDSFGFRFPVPLGGGELDRVFFYPGLPYTVLLDAEGRVARTWIGELTASDLGLLESAILGELAGTSGNRHGAHTDRSGHRKEGP
jgi:thiol-disulfide isomerase/thioredoxin